jgi:putative ABC transport system permease protein
VVSLARAGLLYEWRRYVAAVLALAFSTLLIHAQIGIVLGWFFCMAGFLENSSADLWVSAPDVKSYDQATRFSKANELYARSNSEVFSVEPQVCCWGEMNAGLTGKVYCQLFALDRDTDSNMLMSRDFIKEFGVALDEPGAVVLEDTCRTKFGLNVGDSIELNRKRVKVVGFTDAFKGANWHGVDCVRGVSSMTTALRLDKLDYYMYLLVKLKDPSKAEQVRDEMNAAHKGKLKVWTRKDLFWGSQRYWLFESKQNSQIIFSTILSALIGIVITNQSLRSAILASIRDYAAIRALGVSRRSLSMVVLEQAFWVGVLGLALGLLMTFGLTFVTHRMRIAFEIPFWLPLISAPFIILTSLVSGLLALMVLYKTQPAELLR